jgi:cyclophilin family peptidyl-prolyl cis-trans isomerase
MKRLIFTAALLSVIPTLTLAGENSMVRCKTSLGDIVLELDAEKAPNTVANFLEYVKDGFYDGTIFHRVIDNFMIQGGGFTQDYKQKKTRDPIQNEAANGLKNVKGSIAMARTGDPHSATAQFFINVADNGFLDHTAPSGQGWGYAVFGKVVEGMDVVDKIKGTATGAAGPFSQDAPQTPVVIERCSVEEAKAN